MRLTVAFLFFALFAVALAQDPLLASATAYYQAFAKATSWNDILPFVSSDTVKAIRDLPPDNRDRVFVFYQKLNQAVAGTGPMELADKKVDGDRARIVLQIVGARPTDDFQGQNLNLVREGDAWKVDIAHVVRAMGQ